MARQTKRVPFYVQIARNKRATVVLVVLFSMLLAFVAFWVGLIFPGGWEGGVAVAAGVGVITFAWFLASYYSGGYLLMTMHHAYPASPRGDGRVLYNVVEEMAIAAGVPRPLIFVVPTSAMNAFATGRDPENSVIAVTEGLLERLNRDELQGVVAHEISHIRNYDIRLMMMVATFAGMVVILSEILWYMSRVLFYAGMPGGSNRRGGGAPLLVLAAVAAVISLVAPIMAMLIQFAISRRREYLADASAVELTRYPEGLARALEKIAYGCRGMKYASKAAAHLYIQNPFIRANVSSLFATHPPIQERIRRIRAMM